MNVVNRKIIDEHAWSTAAQLRILFRFYRMVYFINYLLLIFRSV